MCCQNPGLETGTRSEDTEPDTRDSCFCQAKSRGRGRGRDRKRFGALFSPCPEGCVAWWDWLYLQDQATLPWPHPCSIRLESLDIIFGLDHTAMCFGLLSSVNPELIVPKPGHTLTSSGVLIKNTGSWDPPLSTLILYFWVISKLYFKQVSQMIPIQCIWGQILSTDVLQRLSGGWSQSTGLCPVSSVPLPMPWLWT